jgi:hypothetical protein
MIIKEFYKTREDGVNLYRAYSDEGMYIIQNETGNEYSEAIDIEGKAYTYTETDKPIEVEATEATAEDYQSALEDLGVNFNE